MDADVVVSIYNAHINFFTTKKIYYICFINKKKQLQQQTEFVCEFLMEMNFLWYFVELTTQR